MSVCWLGLGGWVALFAFHVRANSVQRSHASIDTLYDCMRLPDRNIEKKKYIYIKHFLSVVLLQACACLVDCHFDWRRPGRRMSRHADDTPP